MIRREAIVGLLGLLAAPLSWAFGSKRSQSIMRPAHDDDYKFGNGRDVYLKTPKGLERVLWEDVKIGDAIVLVDWVEGKTVSIFDMGQAIRIFPEPDGYIAFDGDVRGFVHCVKT